MASGVQVAMGLAVSQKMTATIGYIFNSKLLSIFES